LNKRPLLLLFEAFEMIMVSLWDNFGIYFCSSFICHALALRHLPFFLQW